MSTRYEPSSGGDGAGAPNEHSRRAGGTVVQRVAAALGSTGRGVMHAGATLEITLPGEEYARAQASELLTDREMRAHDVGVATDAMFGAFVDGVQESRTVAYCGLAPIVHARCAAVIRARVGRRLVTWGDGARITEAVCIPLGICGTATGDALIARGFRVIDTTDDALTTDEVHPQQLLRQAVHLVQRERESLERALAEEWCRGTRDLPDDTAGSTLFVDGGLPSHDVVLSSRRAIGVVKSHQTLYAVGSALSTVMSLGAGARSSIFVVTTKWREPVASWYLRVRDAAGRDPWWGLARIEASRATLMESGRTPDEWANEISRWVLAESAPLALPDSRWDTMAYGIRDCEVYLRSVLGPAY